MSVSSDVSVALAPTIAVIATYLLSRQKIREIHILVNDRLDNALEEIASLKLALEESEARNDKE